MITILPHDLILNAKRKFYCSVHGDIGSHSLAIPTYSGSQNTQFCMFCLQELLSKAVQSTVTEIENETE